MNLTGHTNLKARWLEALRGGKYKQSKGVLKGGEGFCCLGVLCDVLDSEKWRSGYASVYYQLDDEDPESNDNYSDTELPKNLRHRLGITDYDQSYLIAMNDGSDECRTVDGHEIPPMPRHSFAQIADYIEQHIDALTNDQRATTSGDIP